MLGSPQIAIAEGDKSLAVTYFKGSPSPWNRPLLTIINQSGETVSKEAVLFGDCADTYPYSPDSSTQVIYDKQREKYFAISGAAQGEQGQNKRFLAQWISPDGKQEESFDLRPEARYYPNAISLSDGKILIICTNIVGPYDHRMESFIFDPDKKTTSTSVSLKSSASLAFPKVAMNENGEGVVTMIGWPSWGERPSSGLYYSKIAKDGTIGEPQLLVRKPFNTAQSAVSTSHFDIVTAVNYGAPSYTYYVINRASGEIRMASITPPTSTNERLAFDAPDICVLPGGMLHLSSSVSKTVPNKPGEDRDVDQRGLVIDRIRAGADPEPAGGHWNVEDHLALKGVGRPELPQDPHPTGKPDRLADLRRRNPISRFNLHSRDLNNQIPILRKVRFRTFPDLGFPLRIKNRVPQWADNHQLAHSVKRFLPCPGTASGQGQRRQQNKGSHARKSQTAK